MHRSIRSGLAVLLLCLGVVALSAQTKTAESTKDDKATKPAETTVSAIVESSLKTGGKQIRMFAFDGDADTYFASENPPTKADHFTLTFDKPVAVKSLAVTTGKPKGDDALDMGFLEGSEDGKKFEELAKFAEGRANVKLEDKKLQAIRIKPLDDMNHPLAIREVVVDSQPKVLIFPYPVEFTLNVADAPDLKEWGEKVIQICERQYQTIAYDLRSDGFQPPRQVSMTLKNTRGVAATGGNRITGSVAYFKAHPNDVGAMVHETVHVVQSYGGRGNPGWLVEGIADYLRFFQYEPGKLRKLKPEQAKYDGSYQTTARFLDFVTQKYDKELVRKLNAVMRQGKYKPEVWKELTGKMVEELGQEWKQSLAD